MMLTKEQMKKLPYPQTCTVACPVDNSDGCPVGGIENCPTLGEAEKMAKLAANTTFIAGSMK